MKTQMTHTQWHNRMEQLSQKESAAHRRFEANPTSANLKKWNNARAHLYDQRRSQYPV